ncbi:MAG: cation-translocating P-type ATPase [Lutimonas sp.]
MSDKNDIGQNKSFVGLSDKEVIRQRELYGSNKIIRQKNLLWHNLFSVAKEPMFILLLATSVVYLLLKSYAEAFTMLAALIFVAGIDVFQNFKSQKAIKALGRITAKNIKVIRNANPLEINIEDLVTEDIFICEEGTIVPADAVILASNDLALNEAILTGESVSVEKFQNDEIYQGTLVIRGYCYAQVKAVGLETALSGIGELVATIDKEKTPLQLKVSKFVKVMVMAGSLAFGLVWIYHWWDSGSMIHGLLHGLTMAMSVLPEEIPVAFSTFMALGAYRLLKYGIIARSPRAVETLGTATVICLDKTGTLTQNLMTVAHTINAKTEEVVSFEHSPKPSEVLEYAMWASEEKPFDPMEISIHKHYSDLDPSPRPEEFRMVKEFPLSDVLPVMTHIFQNDALEYRIGCKGALEGVLKLCHLSVDAYHKALEEGKVYAEKGMRVLGVAKGIWDKSELPLDQQDIKFEYLGMITFLDPIDERIPEVIDSFYNAGIDVKMITGDYKETAVAVAELTHIKTVKVLTGNELTQIKDEDLISEVAKVSVFARVNPEGKLRIINALKKAGQIVAMTGDGVNDAPALKAAHIGISMGKRGTEVAKGAAGLVLVGDDLAKMTDAIFLGRRINQNLIKAIRYIISIHIPIIILVTLPIFIGWLPAMLFSPVHVIFLELIMGPTCSIIYENEPTVKEELKHPTSASHQNLLSGSQLWITILQGLVITAGCVLAGFYAKQKGLNEVGIRTYIFSVLVLSNIFLTLVNRSFKDTILITIRRRNKFIPLITSISIFFLLCILFVPVFNKLFEVFPLVLNDVYPVLMIAVIFTLWIEPFKYFRAKR